jgi:hypothetical protein
MITKKVIINLSSWLPSLQGKIFEHLKYKFFKNNNIDGDEIPCCITLQILIIHQLLTCQVCEFNNFWF